jgi:hypothetical protein
MKGNIHLRQTGLCDNFRRDVADAIRRFILQAAPQYEASAIRDGEFYVSRKVGLWRWLTTNDSGVVASVKVWYTAHPGCGMVAVVCFYQTYGVEDLFKLISNDVASAFSHHTFELFWDQNNGAPSW